MPSTIAISLNNVIAEHMAARSMQDWFDAYAISNQHPSHKAIHWVCVPVIYFCVIGLLFSIPLPDAPPYVRPHLLAFLAIAVVAFFYLRLSLTIAFGMILWSLFCVSVCKYLVSHSSTPLWIICTVLFVAAWIGQFYGHKVEGRKPSFLDDLQFLMIGPAWLLSFVYQRLRIPY